MYHYGLAMTRRVVERIWLPSSDGGVFQQQRHVVLKHGRGVWVETEDGRQFLDANSGLWHVSLGYGFPAVIEAVSSTMAQLSGTSLLRRLHDKAVRLCAELNGLLEQLDPVVFFATSGSEAVDAALRIALAYGVDDGRTTIAHLANGYHGVSLGPLALAGARYRNGAPQSLSTIALPGVQSWLDDPVKVDGEISAIVEESGATIAALILECIQCVGGIVEVPSPYLQLLVDRAHECGAVVIVDEISTGVYRTGPFVVSEDRPIAPDIIVLGKGLTGGVTPMSVVAVRGAIADAVRRHPDTSRLPGTTQGGDPMGCAAALAVLNECRQPSSVVHRERISAFLASELVSVVADLGVGTVVGAGHMTGIRLRLPPDADASNFINAVTVSGLGHGLLLHPLSTGTIPVAPALTISEADAGELVHRLRTVIGDVVGVVS